MNKYDVSILENGRDVGGSHFHLLSLLSAARRDFPLYWQVGAN